MSPPSSTLQAPSSSPPTTAPFDVRIGQLLRGKWRLDRLLGVGGSSRVYAATHRNGRRGAVKLLNPDLRYLLEVRERFHRECLVAARVTHPGVAAVLDDDVTEDGTPFLVMELLEGETLGASLRRLGRLPAERVVEVGLSLLDVLDAIHMAGVVHADIKPENLFWTNAGGFKLLDFGIALAPVDGDDGVAARREGLTMGTPGYMPPEQARGEWSRVGSHSDVFAAGATLYRLLTGAHIHVADSPGALLRMTLLMPPLPVHARMSDAPQALASVLDQALSVEPEHRFESALAMRQALELAARDIRSVPSSRAPSTSPHTTMRSRAVSVPPSSRRLPSSSASTPPSQRGLRRLARSGLALGTPLLVGIALGTLGAAEKEPAALTHARVHDKMVMLSRAFREVAKPVLDRGVDGSSTDADPGVFAAAPPAQDGLRVAYGTSDAADETEIAGGGTGEGGPANQCRTRIDAHFVPMKK